VWYVNTVNDFLNIIQLPVVVGFGLGGGGVFQWWVMWASKIATIFSPSQQP
jgi:hypothetical protein